MYSVIIPVYNEAPNVAELHRRVLVVMQGLQKPFEIVFVNDGSNDETANELDKLHPATLITFRKNFGQTAAIDAGIKQAQGDVLITLDGDLQNPPEEIPKLLAFLESHDYDVVSGWRKERQDKFGKRFISRGANRLRKLFLNDGIHDSGCTLKVYRKACFEDVDLYGEHHRFIPAILRLNGFSIGEVEVAHSARAAGKTKYGAERIFRGFIDMLGLWFWRNYSYRPLHLFGGIGFSLVSLGTALLVLLAIMRLAWAYPLSTSIWPLVAVLAIVAGLQLLITGLLAEVLAKSYYTGRRSYTIKSVVHKV
jgi:glycosyltransferase involved in cell wall biosynthesis